MEVKLEQLKKNFVTIKDIRNKVTTIFQILENHLKKLKQTYSEFVVNNRQNLFVFGLDSFQFQSKLIDIEYEDMKRLFLAINNRMYCEYYKLYKIILDYVKEHISDKKSIEFLKVSDKFPVYKDLEPYKQYNFETIQEIHENSILLLYSINEYIINKESELELHEQKQASGLNINNFVTTFNYNILVIKEKALLFISYIDFFHTLHTKYLQRFAMKMNLMFSQVTHDIRFDDIPKTSEIKKKELINNFQNDQIDSSLIKQIRSSFDDSETNSNDSPNSSSSNSHKENDLSINNVYSKNKNNLEPYDTNYIDPKDINNSGIEKSVNGQGILKNIFNGNVKKMVTGMFKTKKRDLNNLDSQSSDSITNNNIEQMEVLKYKHLSLSEQGDLTPQSDISSNSFLKHTNENVVIKIDETYEQLIPPLINPLTMEDEIELNKTLSQDDMFLEITKQCNQITNLDIETVNDICIVEPEGNVEGDYFIPGDQLNDIIGEKIEENLEEKIDEKNLDDAMSVITMESLVIKNEDEDAEENKPEEETKKKRQYKPRKKKNTGI
jgi:hypothetical protein